MELIKITPDNLATEHICCAIANNNDVQVASKKSWLQARLDEGLVFLKGNVRGKCFIEYIPAEYAWVPIIANNYMYIDCLWVAGQFKGHGYANLLLTECIQDSKAKGKHGLVTLSSPKKMSFLSDPGYLQHQGFKNADTANPYFTLMYLPFSPAATKPCFKESLKTINPINGFNLYYSDQCPFTAKYVPLLEKIVMEKHVPWQTIHLTTTTQAQNAPTPFTTFSLFYNGEFITHEILSPNKFTQILASKGF